MEWERAEVARLERFVHGEDEFIRGRTGLTASICCNIDTGDLDMFWRTSVTLTRKLIFFEDTDLFSEDTFNFTVEETIWLVFQVLVACPALMELHLCFFFLQFRPISENDLVLQMFSVLHTSRTLHKLSIALRATNCENIRYAKIYGERLFDTHLPILLRDNRFLETLALTFDYCTARMSYLFSRNFARLWKLWMYHSCKDFHFSCNPLEEFINLSQIMELSRMSNFTLKELVLSCSSSELVCESFRFAMANELDGACNTKLHEMLDVTPGWISQRWHEYLTGPNSRLRVITEGICREAIRGEHCRIPAACTILRVIVGTGAFSHQVLTSLSRLKLDLPKTTLVLDSLNALVTLLRSNSTLKFVELSHKLWRITLLEGANAQVPAATSHQSVHTSLSTLKLCLSSWAWTEPDTILNCLTLLQKLLGLNTVLKHVEVSSTQPPEPLERVKNLRDFQFAIQIALKQIENELKGNPYLQLSICVGWWQLLRVGTGAVQCERRYRGPCLRSEPVQQEEYIVKVKLRR